MRRTSRIAMGLLLLTVCARALPTKAQDITWIEQHVREAAAYYNVPENYLLGILEAESGFNPNALAYNKNGSIDVGLGQINSYWAPIFGPKLWRYIAQDPRYNIHAAAWILRDCLDRFGYTWRGIGCYHSPRESQQLRYAKRVIPFIRKHTQKPQRENR